MGRPRRPWRLRIAVGGEAQRVADAETLVDLGIQPDLATAPGAQTAIEGGIEGFVAACTGIEALGAAEIRTECGMELVDKGALQINRVGLLLHGSFIGLSRFGRTVGAGGSGDVLRRRRLGEGRHCHEKSHEAAGPRHDFKLDHVARRSELLPASRGERRAMSRPIGLLEHETAKTQALHRLTKQPKKTGPLS